MSVNFCGVDILKSTKTVKKIITDKPVQKIVEVRKNRRQPKPAITVFKDKSKDSCEFGRIFDEIFNPGLYFRV